MASTNTEFRVGIIILIGLAILASSLYWLQGYKLEHNSQLVRLRFDNVGTLAAGDQVMVSGVRRGKVRRLHLTPTGVQVELLLYQDVILHRDARFIIKNFGLMGERFIAIQPGTDSALFDLNVTVDGQYDTGLPDVMGLLGDMVSELRDLVSSFRRNVATDSTLAKLDRTVNNLDHVSSSLAGYLSRNENKFDRAADNFVKASKSLKRILEDNAVKIDSTADRFARVSTKLENFTEQLDSLSHSAREFADKVNNGDGTMQLLLEDRRLYDDLRNTADNIDDLITDIQENPRKYINLTLELF